MYKIVAEVRFNGQIEIIEKLHSIVKYYYPSEYPHWKIENGNTVRIFNGETLETSTEVILYDYQRFIYSVEDPSTDNYFIEKYLKYYKMFQKHIESSEVIRIGVRRIELCIQKSKDKILARYEGIYKPEFLKTLDQENPIDYFNVIEYKNKRITFGPLAKDENNQYINEFTKKEKIPDNMFLIDLDIFSQKTRKSDVLGHLNMHFKSCLEIIKNIDKMFTEGKEK